MRESKALDILQQLKGSMVLSMREKDRIKSLLEETLRTEPATIQDSKQCDSFVLNGHLNSVKC